MAYCGIKNHFDDSGVKGYYAPKNNDKLNPHSYKIINNKKYGGMLDFEYKSHGDNPSPSHYDIVVDMALERKTNAITSRKPR